MQTHTLDSTISRHRDFLREQRKDSFTGKVFADGDVIVFCASSGCKSAHLVAAWQARGGCSACKGTTVLAQFPDRQTIRIRPSVSRVKKFVIKTGSFVPPQVSTNISQSLTAPPTAKPTSNAIAVVAFILALLSFVPGLHILFGIMAVVFGLIGRLHAETLRGTGKELATLSVGIGGIVLIVFLLF